MADTLPSSPLAGSPKAAWAGWLADVGRLTRAFKVFPCRPDNLAQDDTGRPMCKRPLHKGWQGAASWDRKTVEAEWQGSPDNNIGLAIQPGAVALDADIYKPGNAALLAAFEAEYGELPETLEFESANGGFHLIYTTTKMLGNATGSLPKFGEVRGAGGYIVGPGSTADGKPYTVSRLAEPVALPLHVDACLVERRHAAADRALAPGVLLDDPVNIALFTVYLRTDAKPSIAGQEGNHVLAATGAMGSSYGLSEDETVHLMVEHWNSRCDPPWEPEQIEYHGGSGYRSASSRFGNLAKRNPSAMGFRPVSGAPAPADDLWRTMADIAGEAPPRQWAIGTDADGWVPLGDLTFLYGPGGVGKTALLGQICLSVARGEALFGLLPTRRMPVLLVACEDDTAELHRRFERQGRRPDDAVVFASLVGLDAALHPPFRGPAGEDTWLFRALEHKLAALPPGPKLLALDNLAQIYQANYYEPAEITRFLNVYLRRLAQQHEATVVVLAHPSDAQRSSGDGSYGGVQWSAGLRARLYFERHLAKPHRRGDKPQPIGRQRVLSRKKANYADDTDRGLVLDWSDWSFVPVVAPPRPAAAVGFKPVVTAQPDVLGDVVQQAIETVLASKVMSFSGRQLAADAAHLLGSQGHEGLSVETVRKVHLPRLIAVGHPAYRRVEGRGQWRHATKQ